MFKNSLKKNKLSLKFKKGCLTKVKIKQLIRNHYVYFTHIKEDFVIFAYINYKLWSVKSKQIEHNPK